MSIDALMPVLLRYITETWAAIGSRDGGFQLIGVNMANFIVPLQYVPINDGVNMANFIVPLQYVPINDG
jgi:hypothetical protein